MVRFLAIVGTFAFGFGLGCSRTKVLVDPEVSSKGSKDTNSSEFLVPHQKSNQEQSPKTDPVAANSESKRNRSSTSNVDAIIRAEDRLPEDRKLDAGRKPTEFLTLLGLEPGMRVADLMAGTGYTTELLARIVAPNGTVYGQNNAFVLKRFAEGPWSERLKRPAMKNVVRVDRELDDPLPSEARELDMVVMVLFYHDTVWQKVDRIRMNRSIFAALRSGGRYVVVDHSGAEGTGMSETKTLHRIEESAVRGEIERSGFRLVSTIDFLRMPGDTRDWDASPRAAAKAGRRGQSDRFVLVFEKP